jgi:hypothetical protein
MKTTLTKNKNVSLRRSSFFFLFSLFFLLLSCEQPFKAGLGPIIDLQSPEIELTNPESGTYIRGTVTFSGWASDDTQLDGVWFRISNYNNVIFDEYDTFDHSLGTFYRIPEKDIRGDSRKAYWSFTLDTKLEIEFDDGSGNFVKQRAFLEGASLKIQMLARDYLGKENANVSAEYAFIVKNDGPQISVDNPRISAGTGRGDYGGIPFNFGYLSDTGEHSKSFARMLYTKQKMTGMITDDEGINHFPGTATIEVDGKLEQVELFPPQIRFWEVDATSGLIWTLPEQAVPEGQPRKDATGKTGNVNESDPGKSPVYMKGYFPTLDEVPWVAFSELPSDVGSINGDDKRLIFDFRPPDVSGKYYGFEIRAQSIDKARSPIRYPAAAYQYNYWNDLDKDVRTWDAGKSKELENLYVLINIREPQEFPILDLYGLHKYDLLKIDTEWKKHVTADGSGIQDIYGKGSERDAVSKVMNYKPVEIEPQDITDKNHPYVDNNIVFNTGGGFTLRMKASHSGGINSAAVYWEKDDDKSYRGRFIWDPADEATLKTHNPNWKGEAVPRSEPYETWGFTEPDYTSNMVRSFVYTYYDDGFTERFPNRDRIANDASKSTIQKYLPSSPTETWDDDGNRHVYEFDELPENDGKGGASYWDNVNYLLEGTYNIYVYATSNSGTRVAVPYTLTIKIDRGRPEIKLNEIQGKASELDDNLTSAVTVNGVIRPSFLFSDSRPEDTDFRTGSTTFFMINKSGSSSDPKNYYPEKAYILIPNTVENISVMEKSFDLKSKKIKWPDFSSIKPDTPVLTPLTTRQTMTLPDKSELKISKSGVINGSDFRFLTSNNYSKWNDTKPLTLEDSALADGEYRLYVFARDNAFNVNSINFPIKVDFESDTPVFKFSSIGSSSGDSGLSVTQADWSYDFSDTGKGFIDSKGEVRNKFSAMSVIGLTISDDDGLDLGTSVKASGIEVTLYGTKVVDKTNPAATTINIPETADLPGIPLGDIIKQTFAPQADSGPPDKVKTGDITQDMLLAALRKGGAPYYDIFGIPAGTSDTAAQAIMNNTNSLPDGIYRVDIKVQDLVDTEVKLVQDPSDLPSPPQLTAQVKDPIKSFYFVIDNKKPVVKINQTSTILPPNGEALKGTVSDENGPITLTGWRVLDSRGNPVTWANSVSVSTINPGEPYLTVKPLENFRYVNGKWTYDFNYTMELNGCQAGAFTFELTFKDRFGMTSIESLKYSVDDEPPRVSLVRPIETFSRPFDDVNISPYVQLANTEEAVQNNKERLAVKVVQFTINAQDNFKVKGVRWWLLPANVESSDENNFTPSTINISSTTPGFVTKYDAFPAKKFASDESSGVSGVYYSDGTFYKTTTSSGTATTTTGTITATSTMDFYAGAYGFVDVVNRKFTIAVDTTKMKPDYGDALNKSGNGEYRLHIIAIDEAGNESRVTAAPVSSLFQTVFFLQEEDKPYLDKGISPGYIDPAEAAFVGLGWPKKVVNGAATAVDYEPEVLGGTPVIRGTIWENNGFFLSDGTTLSWPGSITVWFNGKGTDLPSNWETLVQSGSDFSNPDWEMKIIPDDKNIGLAKQGRNLSLAIALTDLFPNALKTDGRKRYIIKATDSPVNKLYDDGGAGIPMGVGNTGYPTAPATPNDESVRVSSYRQYAFVYDAMPPKVVIDTPTSTPTQNFGTNFTTNFILGGYIEDANLATYENTGKYYFEYYLNNRVSARQPFPLNPGKNFKGDSVSMTPIEVNANGSPKLSAYDDLFDVQPGSSPAQYVPKPPATLVENEHIYAITKDPIGKITVYFRIKASEVTASIATGKGIIPQETFNGLLDGMHTLNLFAWDKTGKEGASWVNFTKDMNPPTISFTNLAGNNRPYTASNPSKVDKLTEGTVTGWWSKTSAQREVFLFGNSTTSKLPLTTLSYVPGNGVPELRGVITDLVSNIKVRIINSSPSTNTLVDHNGDTISAALVGSGDINISSSSFKYWIDDELVTKPAGRYLALIDGAGSRSVRWTIYLTEDGRANGKPLCDGVHTIVLTAADEPGAEIPVGQRYMIAFRIDSKAPDKPKATVMADTTVLGDDNKDLVFGNVAQQKQPVFTIDVTGTDANLDRLELTIKDPGGNDVVKVPFENKTDPSKNQIWSKPEWKYFHSGDTTPPNPNPNPIPPNSTLMTEDYVLFKGSYEVLKVLFDDQPSGKYEGIVAAYDTAGNKSEEYTWSFTYDKDSPKIEFTNPDNANQNDPATATETTLKPQNFIFTNTEGTLAVIDPNGILQPNGKINRLTSESLRIQGTVMDDFSPIRKVQSQIEKWNWLTEKWVVIEEWEDIDVNKALLSNKLLQVSWTKNLLGQDKLTNTRYLDLADPNTWKPKPANTTAVSPEGLYRIRIRAKDASYTANGTNNDYNSNNWLATDMGNPVYSGYQYFYYDRANPVLNIEKIHDSPTTTMATYYSKPGGGFKFEGTVRDNNRFAKVEVKFERMKDGKWEQLGSKAATLTRLTPPIPPATDPDYNAADPAPTLNIGGVKQNWKAEFTEAANYPDGRYKVTITAYDMTGRTSKEEKSFILDSTPPGARFTGPVKKTGYRVNNNETNPLIPLYGSDSDGSGFASVILQGGETSVITGETWDRPNAADPGKGLAAGENGSESGISQMWFHLGFIDGSAAFPTEEAIKNWEEKLAGKVPTNGVPAKGANESDIAYRNRLMDYLSEYEEDGDLGNAWFKLGGNRKYLGSIGTAVPVPTGFLINNPNIYDWRMEIPVNHPDFGQIGGLKYYTNDITVKGRQYTVGSTATRQMVRSVDGQAGVYRLPLWIRLVDIAGNVAYYCHDIWIYPDGDIPSTTIESPNNGTRYNARGGTISVDGVAKSNTSVYDVIFRVFADNVTDTNLDGIKQDGSPGDPGANPPATHTPPKTIGTNGTPSVANIVKINGYNTAEQATVNLLPADYRPAAGATWQWQKANLTMTGGSGEPLIPWSIMLGQEGWDQIIKDHGFASTGTTKDMVRIWLEVFVFNGEGKPVRSSIYPNDNQNTGGGGLYGTADPPGTVLPLGARPYVKAFYIKTGSAEITHPNVGSWTTATTPATPFTDPFVRRNFMWNAEVPGNQGDGGYGGAGTETRSNKFAVSATLNPRKSGDANLGEVAFRVRLDGIPYGGWNTVWKKGDNALPGTNAPFNSPDFKGVRISVRDTNRYYFDYAIDSMFAAPPEELGTIFASVNNGNWARTGGTVTVQIRMRDDSSPPNEAEQTIQVSVDNFAPVADPNAKTNPTVAGSNVDFMGRVYDYATSPATDAMNSEYTPRKLDKVYAWFTQNGRFVNMNGGVAGVGGVTGPTTTPRNALVGRTAAVTYLNNTINHDTVTGINLTRRGGAAPAYTDNALTSIDVPQGSAWVKELSSSTAIPGSRMVWSPVNSADYDIRWSFTLDSNNLPDGPIVMHYIAVDAAGNASYYTQNIIVKNKYPEISKVTLYTQNLGIGAAYTAPEQVEYYLNDYRGRMFANYTDAADNTANTGLSTPIPGLAAGVRRSDTIGYLNSGFISKNNYIGFKVETLKGNRPLNFRLQHVTRERVTLNKANLQTLLNNRTATDNINLYTIAWHGDYSSNNWKAIGVPIDNAPLGTHFVLQAPEGSSSAGVLPTDFKDSSSAQVWKYTLKGVTKAVSPGTDQGEAVVVGPDDFRFYDTADFADINEKDGSHPDADDTKQDNPISTSLTDEKGTAFFLIRVWDSVITDATWTDKDGTVKPVTENDQLYDALVIGMNVYKTDKTDPIARLYDLNPYTETAVTENNKAATIRNAANPTAIGSNIVRGGLYNDGTTRAMVRSGFIDPRDQSKALDPKNGLFDNQGTLISGNDWPDYPLRPVDDDGNVLDKVPTTGTTRDKVSGKIILRGLAWDDQLINEIRISINGTATPILRLNTSTAKMEAVAPAQAFAAETLNWKTGHTVEWAYVWDTGENPNTNVPIQVIVEDYNTPPRRTSPSLPAASATSTPADTDTLFHNKVWVDIVPYITGFERQTPTFTTKRSLQGWYSFYQGETGIKVKGYNFGSGATAVDTNTAITNKIAITPVAASTSPTERTFSIPTTATSGAIALMFGTIPAYNNTSTTEGKSWNKETNTFTPGSDLWVNRHYAHIWRSAEAVGSAGTAGTIIGASTSSEGMDTPTGRATPSMSLQYMGNAPGTIHAAWSKYNRDEVYYGTNTGTASRLLLAGEPYTHTDIDYYNGTDMNTNDRYNASVVVSYQRDGGPRLVLKATIQDRSVNGGDDNSWIIGAGVDGRSTSSDRWKNPRIRKLAVSGTSTTNVGNTNANGTNPTQALDNNPGTIIISAFDSFDNRLLYSRQSGAFANNSNTNSFGTVANQAFLDGGGTVEAGTTTAANLGSVPIRAADVANAPATITANGVTYNYGTIGRSNSAGQYSAIDFDSAGRPVIAYFDDQHQTLRLLYANSNNPTTAAAWTRRYVLPEGHSLRLGSGSYVSMKIQRANEAGSGTAAQGDTDTIHLAFYNSNNKAVVYAFGTREGVFTASVIDRVVEGGQWTDISLDQNNRPWIVYADSSRTGNRDGARIAYLSTGTGAGAFTRTLTDPITGTDITGWEALTMPSDYKVNNDRLNIAVWPPKNAAGNLGANSPIGGWNAAVGYGSDKFRIGYFFKPGAAMANQP